MIQFLFNLYFRYWKKWGWFGDFPNWQAAQATCGGYDSNEIIEKVRASALKVKNGEAAFERDSVLFFEEENDENLLKCLEKVANSLQKGENSDFTEGVLRVVDFGGSLGSTYFQHQKALKKYPNLIWCVVEQPHFVEIGKREFETENLYFEYTLQAAFERFKPHFFLLNSVLQYILNYNRIVLYIVLSTQINLISNKYFFINILTKKNHCLCLKQCELFKFIFKCNQSENCVT